MALDRSAEERLDALVDVLAQTRDLALRDACAAHRLDQVVDRTGRDPVHVSLLDDRRQGLLGGAARLQESREVRALSQLRDGQLDPPDAGLPATLPVPIAVVDPLRAPRSGCSASKLVDLSRHQPLAGIGQQLADQVRIGTLLDQLQQRHSLVGHRRLRCGSRPRNPDLYRRPAMTASGPPAARCATPTGSGAASYTTPAGHDRSLARSRWAKIT